LNNGRFLEDSIFSSTAQAKDMVPKPHKENFFMKQPQASGFGPQQ